MNKKTVCGIIGITDDGQPIITANHQCSRFMDQGIYLPGREECQRCKFSDFHKACGIILNQSICRCPENKMHVAEIRKNEQEAQLSPLTEKFISNIKGGVITCIFDCATQSSKAIYLNAGWTAITGYTLEDLNREKGGNPQALIFPEDKPVADLEYSAQMKLGNEYALLYRVIRKGGATIWVIDRGVVSTLPNGDLQNQSIVTEVTEIKEQEERLRRLAQIDQLTDLYNKGTFTQQAQMVLERQHNKLHALMILDIDNFKKINDSMGHSHGDKVLEAVANCLKSLFCNRDLLGRIGGDEFMVLMTDISEKELVKQKAEKLCAAIRSIKLNKEADSPITMSLGITFSAENKSYEEMFHQADCALYLAKNSGKDKYSISF